MFLSSSFLSVGRSVCLSKACSGVSSQAALQTSSSSPLLPPLRCCRSLPLTPSRSPLSRLLLCGNHGNEAGDCTRCACAAPAFLHHQQAGKTGAEPSTRSRSLCWWVYVLTCNRAMLGSSDKWSYKTVANHSLGIFCYYKLKVIHLICLLKLEVQNWVYFRSTWNNRNSSYRVAYLIKMWIMWFVLLDYKYGN